MNVSRFKRGDSCRLTDEMRGEGLHVLSSGFWRGGCLISGKGKIPAGLSWIAGNMSIPIARPFSTGKESAGNLLPPNVRNCLSSSGNVKIARFINLITNYNDNSALGSLSNGPQFEAAIF